MKTKYIVIVGSIMSGLGKGIVTSSISKILQVRGFKVVPIKFDGYLNVDCGTMNPFRHGEVFVLEDGGEVDMDFGTYERFLNINLPSTASITGGKIFKRIIEKERKGEFLGRDVQFVPHLTNEIKNWIRNFAKESGAEIVLIEVGGTVGDLENGYFLEAMRQLAVEEEVLFIQLTYVPSLSGGEQKTKPTQHANKLLLSMGIKPHIIIAREEEKLSDETVEKIAMFCGIGKNDVFDDPYVNTVYELPLVFEKQNIYDSIAEKLKLPKREGDWSNWKRILKRINDPKKEVDVAIVGKYTKVKDAYVSITEALVHAGAACNVRANYSFIESEKVESDPSLLKGYNAIIVPGGFGKRGVEGKIKAIEYARTNKIPFLGLCLGMQLMVVEYARNVLGWDAHSTEFDKNTPYPVIDLLSEQREVKEKGATMRLGAYEMRIKKGTKTYEAYGKDVVFERHRHRYEVNPQFVKKLEEGGLVIAAINPLKNVVEAVEWSSSFGIGTQAHPELKSRLEFPAPLFVALLKAAMKVVK